MAENSRKSDLRMVESARQIRLAATPYLPPPVVDAIERIDNALVDSVGLPEASVTLTGTILIAWVLLSMMRLVTNSLFVKGRAVQDDDDDNVLSTGGGAPAKEEYDETVLLCGPTGSGKTRLFYQLCYEQSNVPTLMSLKANVGLATPPSSDDALSSKTTIRYVDWPGHASKEPVLVDMLETHPLRVVLVLDATQPVAAAADVLYHLMEFYAKKKLSPTPVLFVACHKKDFPKAKNARRIKIQIRTELERILKTKKSSEDGGDASWWPAGNSIELDSLGFVKLHFVATTAEGKGSPELLEYCKTGKLPEEGTN